MKKLYDDFKIPTLEEFISYGFKSININLIKFNKNEK